MISLHLTRALLPLVLLLPGFGQDQRPPIFADLDFAAAQQSASEGSGLVILDAMTSWCGPCKQMDRTTWIDPRLVAWVDANAVAIQLDMDLHTELKQRLEIRAFPTIVLFRDGQEFDRIVGLRSADEMLEWLGAAKTGKRAKDTVLERLTQLRAAADGAATWNERASLVSDLMWFDEFDEALVEHLWLWRNLPESADRHRERYRWSTQRFSMRELADKLPTATKALRALRDESSASVLDGSADANGLRDWIELNYTVNDEAATTRWAASAVETRAGLERVRKLENRLFDLLVDAGQWRAAGLALVDPVGRTRRDRDDLGAYDEDQPAKGGMIPAIPMGGMQPATKVLPVDAAAPQESKPEPDDEPVGEARKSVPMVPMTSTPAKAPQAAEPAGEPGKQARKSVPMIRMSAKPVATGKQVSTGKQAGSPSIPMIPMGAKPVDAPEDESVAVQVRRLLTEQFRRTSARRYGALLAAGRGDEALAVSGIVLDELDDVRARAALVAASLRAGALESARERHQLWLDEIAR